MNARPKLRIGVLLDGGGIPAWAAHMLERVQASACAQVVLLVVDASPRPAPPPLWRRLLRAPAHTARAALRRLLLGFNARWLELPSPFRSAFEPRLLSPAFDAVARLPIAPQRSLTSDRPLEADVAAIRSHDLDVLLRVGFRILRGPILEAARHGVWALHHGDNRSMRGGPPGFWEVMQMWPAVGATLQVIGEDVDNGLVLARTATENIVDSLDQTLDNLYWKALSLVPRQLALLHAKGPERYFADVRASQPHPDFYSQPLFRSPDLPQLARLVARKAWRKLRRRLDNLRRFDQWILLVRFADDLPSSLWRYRRLLPPKDRFWADPFVLQRDGRYYLFFEELVFARGKGHLSVAEIDEQGRVGPVTPILVKDTHLSYPFVIEHGGELYMIPEEQEQRCVPLYRCVEFPARWEKVMNLLDDVRAVDATLHYHGGRWWLFANLLDNGVGANSDELHLFSAPEFPSRDWTPHPQNPVVSDVQRARPGGRLFERDGRLYRPSQDCGRRYGWALNLNLVERLDAQEYRERPVTRAEPTWAPDMLATHTFNAAGRLYVMDAEIRRPRRG